MGRMAISRKLRGEALDLVRAQPSYFSPNVTREDSVTWLQDSTQGDIKQSQQ